MSNDLEAKIANQIIDIIKAERDQNAEVSISSLQSYHSISLFKLPIFRIKCGKSKKYISVNPLFKDTLNNFKNIEREVVKSDPWLRVIIYSQDDINKLSDLFLTIYDEAYSLVNAEKFSCCSRYELCSDAKQCIHPDKSFAMGCFYRRNLLDGKIFYGKNSILTGNA